MKVTRFILLVVSMLVLLLWPAPGLGAAGALNPCEPFDQVQTYQSDAGFYRAPAWYYARTVTIHYEGTGCTSVGANELVTRVEGTATIFGGSDTSARVLETRPFTSTETLGISNAATFPGWWTCKALSARYTWTIPDMYSFSASGDGGRWSYRQTALTDSPKSSAMSFDSCRG